MNLTVCGRPLAGDLASFQPVDSSIAGIGDPNYGYVILPDPIAYKCPTGSTLVTSLPSNYYVGGEQCQYPQGLYQNQPIGPVLCPIIGVGTAPEGCIYPYIPPGCLALQPGVVIAEANAPALCAGNWTSQSTTTNRILGCSGIAYSSQEVLPDACPVNTDWCPSFMAEQCTHNGWFPGTWLGKACDTYASSARGVVVPGQTLDVTANLIAQAVSGWVAAGGKPTDDSAFVKTAIKWCSQYPGACDAALSQVCQGYSSGDLSPTAYAGRKYDPNGTNALQVCGCFLPPSQYVKNLDVPCNATCAFPGAIPLSSLGPSVVGPPAECSTTECAIDDVVINYVNSTSSSLNLSQICGKPNHNACYFNGISANDPQDPGLKLQISTTCSTCFDYDPTTYQATQVPCPGSSSTTLAPRPKTGRSSAAPRSSAGGWTHTVYRWRWWILAAVVGGGVAYLVVKNRGRK